MDKLTKKDLKDKYKNREVIGGIYRIICSASGNFWLKSSVDMPSAKNRFAFAVNMNTFPEAGMLEDWKKFGADSFSLEVLEEIKKKETQTEREFSDDVDLMLEIWTEKLENSTEGGI